MKRFTYILAFVVIIIFPTLAYGAANARLIIDYEEITGLDVPPIIMNNRVMVPARGIFERVGGNVEWNYLHRQVTVQYNNDILVMTINETIAWRNGEIFIMDVPPIIHNNRTLIPLRFPAEAFGFCVDWDGTSRTAIINSGNSGSGYSNNEEPPGELPKPPDPGDKHPYLPEKPADPPDEHTGPPDGHTDPPSIHNGNPNLANDISSVPIQPESHPITNIITLHTPRENGAMAYTIIASSSISDVNHFLLADNRLVVDIYNSMTYITGPFFADGPVNEIRASQFTRSPYVTRVVFELTNHTDYSVSLSYDRHVLTIAFAVNNVTITPIFNTHTDTLHIRGDFQPSVRLSAASYPQYLTIYVDNASIDNMEEFKQDGVFTSHLQIVRQTNGVAVIHVFMENAWPSIELNHGKDYVSIILHGGLSGIRYDFWSRELRISRDIIPNMDITQLRHNNEYLLNRYTLTLPVAADGLGLGSLYIADNYICTITVHRNGSGNTKIVFDTARVMAFTVHETPAEIIIRAHLPQEVHPVIVVIDPGHGGRDPGAVHHGVRESDIVLTISHMVAERLNRHPNIGVYMTRHTDEFVPLAQRTEFANQVADLFVSVHANAVVNRPNVTGIETWYILHPREDNLSINSRQFAQIMQRRLINASGAVDRGIKTTPYFVVLRDTTMPAVLLEVGFLTNAQEAARLATTVHQQLLAQAIYQGILEVLDMHGPLR